MQITKRDHVKKGKKPVIVAAGGIVETGKHGLSDTPPAFHFGTCQESKTLGRSCVHYFDVSLSSVEARELADYVGVHGRGDGTPKAVQALEAIKSELMTWLKDGSFSEKLAIGNAFDIVSSALKEREEKAMKFARNER